MALRNKNIAIGSNKDVIGLKKECRIASTAGLAKRHEKFAIRAELENLMPSCSRRSRCVTARARGSAGAVRNPHVAIAVDENPVGCDQQTAAEALDQFSVLVKMQY